MPEYGLLLACIFPYENRIADSAPIQENTDQRKPIFCLILCSDNIFNSFSSPFIPQFVTVLFCSEFSIALLEIHSMQVLLLLIDVECFGKILISLRRYISCESCQIMTQWLSTYTKYCYIFFH